MHSKSNDTLRDLVIVLYKLAEEDDLDLIRDAIHDTLFGHSVRNDYYITEEEYMKTEDEILELLEINKEDLL